MKHELAVELTDRVRDLVDRNTTEMAESVLKVPASFYTDRRQWQKECEFLADAPAVAAPSVMLREPGQYVARTVNNGRRIIVNRDEDGVAHVFLNACRHRGAAIVDDGEGCTNRFTCPYHNWTYSNDGSLKGIPFQEGFEGVNKETHGLIELPSVEQYGLIWYLMRADTELNLSEWLGDFGPELEQWGYEKFDLIGSNTYAVDANWKNALEAFTEFYHFKFVHANSIVGQGTISNVCAFDAFGYHSRNVSALASIADLTDEKSPEYHGAQHLGVIYSVFPNLVIANSPIGLEYLQFMPGKTPDKGYLFYIGLSNHRIGNEEERAMYQSILENLQEVLDEDLEVITACTNGLNNGLEQVVVGRNEIGTQHFIKSIQAATS